MLELFLANLTSSNSTVSHILIESASSTSVSPSISPPDWLEPATMIAELAYSSWEMSFTSWFVFLFIGLLKLIFWTVFFVVLLIWWCQSLALYMPSAGGRIGELRQNKFDPAGHRIPTDHELPYEEYFIETADNVMIHSWFIPQPNPETCPSVLFFHGNAGNIGNRLFNARQMYHYLGCNILMVDYRGYGNSHGVPSEYGFQLDALGALDFLRSHKSVDPSKIFVFGSSLGGAVTIWTAKERSSQIAGIIVENTFTSVKEMFFVILSGFCSLNSTLRSVLSVVLSFFMTSHWTSVNSISTLNVPVLFMSGLADELIPPVQMKQLYEAVPNSTYKEFYGVADGQHNTTFYQGGMPYYNAFDAFIKKFSHTRK